MIPPSILLAIVIATASIIKEYFDLKKIQEIELAFNYNKVLEEFYKEIVNKED